MKISSGFVYLVQMGENGPVKIGWAGSLPAVGRRIDGMQTGCPSPLFLRGVMAGARTRERELHNELDSFRLRGEWFSWCDQVEALVVAADAGDGVLIRHRRSDFTDRMPIEAASTIWRNVNLSLDDALRRMPGWTAATAKRVLGPRRLHAPRIMDAATAKKIGAKGGAVMKAKSLVTRWKSPAMKVEHATWLAVWRSRDYSNDQQRADAMPEPLKGKKHMCRRIFGRADPKAKFKGGRPSKRKTR